MTANGWQLNNSGGSITAGTDLTIGTPLQLDNSGGTISATGDVTVSTGHYQGAGAVLQSGGDLDFRPGRDFTSSGTLSLPGSDICPRWISACPAPACFR